MKKNYLLYHLLGFKIIMPSHTTNNTRLIIELSDFCKAIIGSKPKVMSREVTNQLAWEMNILLNSRRCEDLAAGSF